MEMTKDDYFNKGKFIKYPVYERSSSIINLLIIAKEVNFRSDSCEYNS